MDFPALYRHMEWADARIWETVLGLAGFNDELHERLFHIHATQHAYLQLWKGEALDARSQDEFSSMESLREWAEQYHRNVVPLLRTLESRLDEALSVSWVKHFVAD